MKPTCNVKDVAQALIAAADAKGAVEAVVHDVLTVTEAFESDPVLVVELQEPAVPIEKRRNALTAALKGSVHPVVVNALLILQASNALQVLHTFADAVCTAAESQAGHHVADVTTASPLAKEDRTHLETALHGKFGGTTELRESVDPGLIGGMTVRVGGWNYDASVRGALDRLKQHLYART